MTEVRILGQVITAMYGTLSAGAILRTDEKFAAHLVNDCGAAEYTKSKTKAAPVASTAQDASTPAASAKPGSKKKANVTPQADSGSEGLGTVIVPEVVPLRVDPEIVEVQQTQVSADVCTPPPVDQDAIGSTS